MSQPAILSAHKFVAPNASQLSPPLARAISAYAAVEHACPQAEDDSDLAADAHLDRLSAAARRLVRVKSMGPVDARALLCILHRRLAIEAYPFGGGEDDILNFEIFENALRALDSGAVC